MRYKTSCFNPTLAKHNLKRFWPLPVAILVFVGLLTITDYYTSMQSIHSGPMEAAAIYYVNGMEQIEAIETEGSQFIRMSRSAVYGFSWAAIMIQLFAAILSALLVMQHIHGRKQIQFYHGLPLSRRCVYTTHVVTGYLMALVPMLLVELIIMVMALSMGAEAFPVLQLMGVTAAAFTIFYGVAIIACVLAGQTFGAVLLYAGMNCFVVAIMSGGAGVASCILYGYDQYILLEEFSMWLTPVWRLMEAASPLYTDTGVGMPYGYEVLPFVIYTAAGLGLLALGGFLYKIRKGEMAGETIAFSFIRGLCKVLVALMAGLGGTVFVIALVNSYNDFSFPAVTALVIGLLIVGWVAAEMVIRKTFRVFGKKSVSQCLSLVVLMLLLLVGAKLDVFGYVNRVPDLTETSGAALSMYGTCIDVEPADALEFHETVLAHQEELSNNTSYYGGTDIQIYYYDENGESLMSRSYHIARDEAGEILDKFMEITAEPNYVYQSWFDYWEGDVTEDDIWSAQLYSGYHYYEDEAREVSYLKADGKPVDGYLGLNSQEGETLYRAIVKDIQAGNLPSYFCFYVSRTGEISYGQVEFTLLSEPYVEEQNLVTQYYSVSLYPSMTYTMEALAQMGVTVNPEVLK